MSACDTPAPATVDPLRCPLCGRANQCALALEQATGVPQGPCWCEATNIAPDTLAQIPPRARGLACLCPACAAGLAKGR